MFTSPVLLKKIFPSLTWDVRELRKTRKTVYLTFDDGPMPVITPWVLDLLREQKVRATFFCLGKNIEDQPELFKRIGDEGHSIGNHTFNHLKGWRTPNQNYFEDIERAQHLVHSKYFRPPYGKIKISQITRLRKHYKIVMWDVLSRDFDQSLTGEDCLQNIVVHSKPGSIVVFHDSYKAEKNLRFVLPRAIEFYKKQGYTFSILS